MRDPHVEAVYYDAGPEHEGVEYRDPPPVDWETDLATYRLDDGVLTAWPKDHYATSREAQEALRPELEAWEAHVDLTKGRGKLRFTYKDADLADRDPPPPGSVVHVLAVGNASAVASAEGVHVVVGCSQYPGPPEFTRIDTDAVRDLLARYRQYQDGREPFASMAYAVMTRIEARAGSRSEAAKRYNISQSVLNRLGGLVSTGRGGPLEVRKFKRDGADPMDVGDRAWLQKAVPAVIRQVASVEAGADPARLTATDLP